MKTVVRIVTAVCCILGLTLIPVQSRAYTTKWTGSYPMGNGKSICYYNKAKTNYLWIGDSRMVQMYGCNSKDSVVACWGASYGTTCSYNSMQIDNKYRFKEIKKIVKKLIKKHGSANVVLVPTINDYGGHGSPKYAISKYMASYKRIKKISKNIRIITPSLIKKYRGNSCKLFNKAIKKKVKHYVTVKFKAKHYNLRLGDRVHYSNAGLNYMTKIVHKYCDDKKKK